MIRKLIVNGTDTPVAAVNETEVFDGFELDRSILVSNNRSIGSRQEIPVHSPDDIVEIKFEDNTTWIGNASEFQEIFNTGAKRSVEDEGSFEVPGSISDTTNRGVVADLAINVFNFFKRKTKTIVGDSVRDFAKKVEDKVQPQPGLYMLDSSMRKRTVKNIPESANPFLLFIHGTNSNSEGAFGALAADGQTPAWKFMTATYGENILTFDHKTFTHSPLENAFELLSLLPQNATVHLISHSRGGLVGDIIARCNTTNLTIGFTDVELAVFDAKSSSRKFMTDINAIAKKKNLTVGKFIRVASPSMGTSLLSDRLDHYLNTILNLVGTATGVGANPIYMGVKALVAEAASTKSNVDVLPGIEAMVPDSPFIKMLNNPANVIESPLTVISGNCKVHLELKALLVILTKLYFRRKNDLVVDTWSMYFGTPRRKETMFFLDDQKGTDHVHYFSSKTSQAAIQQALESKTDSIPGFKTLQQADITDANRNAAMPFISPEVRMDLDAITGRKPILVLLPGIMGSNLYRDEDRIWVDFWSFVKGDLIKLDINSKGITAPSLMGSSYRKIVRNLSGAYDVLPFAYDWRNSLTVEAEKLNTVMQFLLTKKQPIQVIAHSMGGVLFREFMINGSQWETLNKSNGFRGLFLGAPLGGSYLIPETLCGRGGNISKLSKLDLKHDKKDLLKVFSQCPGLYNLLPLSTTPYDFSKAKTWQDLFANSQRLGTEPSSDILKGFTAFRDKINSSNTTLDYKNIIYVAGKSDTTTVTYDIENPDRDNAVVFKSTSEGDGSVTWASGIPDQLKQRNQVYYSHTEHGELANDPDLFEAFQQLLSTGTTTLLSKTAPLTRSLGALSINPKSEVVPVDAGNIELVAMGVTKPEKDVVTDIPLKISISNGDLRYAAYPLMTGHFYKDGIMSAEKVLDIYYKGMLREKHALGLYPGNIGTHEVFLTIKSAPKGAIIVGLGEAGELNGYQLELTVAQGLSKYLLELRNLKQVNKEGFQAAFRDGIGVSALIVGGGYGGLSIESSLKSIILGVKKANMIVGGLNNSDVGKIEFLEFVELYEDRSLQAFYTLQKLEADKHLNIVMPVGKIRKLQGIRKRVPFDYQQDWWQKVSVTVEKSPTYSLRFIASTGSAREEVRNLNSNAGMIGHFINEISRDNKWSPQLAKTVFELLIPNDFKDAVRNQFNILWRLDENSAAFPWELLQDTATQLKPLCVNAGMIRQLATQDYRTQIKRSYGNNALVIGDPNLEGFVHQLPGAVQEATKVSAIIAANRFTVTTKINKKFAENMQSIFQDEYKIIHLAGHGNFPEGSKKEGEANVMKGDAGMLIGNNMYLSTKEINQMSQVPEFVFINCCFLGQVDGDAEQKSQQYHKLAANLGVQLIQMGVKAVVAAGWAVDDNAALLFSDTFYTQMFAGATFSDAVRSARSECFEKYSDNNTWGAYQCYGDPFYKFTEIAGSKVRSYKYVLPVEVEVDLNNLYNKIMESRPEDFDWLLSDLNAISEAIDKAGIRNGSITEMETRILMALKKDESAVAKISQMLKSERADYTVSSIENLYNMNMRLSKLSPEKTADDVKEIIDNFSYLLKIGDTSQRHLLLAMSYKVIFAKSSTDAEKLKYLKLAAQEYKLSYEIADKNGSAMLDPLCNWLQLESMLILSDKKSVSGWGKTSVNKYKLPTLKTLLALLEDSENAGLEEERDYEFWDALNSANVLLTKYCMSQADVSIEQIDAAVKQSWDENNVRSMLLNGLDHLYSLATAASLSSKSKAKTLGAGLQRLGKLLSE